MKTDESRLNRMMSKKLLHLSSTIPSVLITPQQHHSFSALRHCWLDDRKAIRPVNV